MKNNCEWKTYSECFYLFWVHRMLIVLELTLLTFSLDLYESTRISSVIVSPLTTGRSTVIRGKSFSHGDLILNFNSFICCTLIKWMNKCIFKIVHLCNLKNLFEWWWCDDSSILTILVDGRLRRTGVDANRPLLSHFRKSISQSSSPLTHRLGHRGFWQNNRGAPADDKREKCFDAGENPGPGFAE